MELKKYETRIKDLEGQIAKLVHYKEVFKATAIKVEEMIPEIEKRLKTLGLTIVGYRYTKTGMDESRWSEGDKLHVCLDLRPTGSKFKFVRFRGYTNGGESMNKYDRSAKARKIEDVVGHGIRINDLSLEIRGDEDTKTILANMWVEDE